MNINKKLPFLYVLLENNSNLIKTSIYRKKTDKEPCLNYKSECSQKYKNSVITNYLNRAYNITNNWLEFHQEAQHIKQILINNNFTNTVVDTHIKKFINKKINNEESIKNENKNPIKVLYKNQMQNNYKLDERIIKNIIMKNTKCKMKKKN